MRYYKLGEPPAYYITAWYKLLSGKWEFGKVHAAETTVDGVTVELTTADGSEYGLHHMTNIWRGTEQIRAKILDELADLTAFRLSAEKVLGELYGNAQAYRL